MTELGLEIDGVSMRTEAFNVSTQNGRWSLPAKRGDDTVISARSGYTFVPNKPFEAGSGVLTVWAVGKNLDGTVPATHTLRQQALRDNVARLQRFFTRTHRLSHLRAEQPDGTWRVADVQWTDWEDPDVSAGGTRAEWTIGYSIPGVWWSDETQTTQSSPAGAALPYTFDLSAFANMTGQLEDAVLTVTGPLTNPRITDAETGAWVQFTGSISTGQTWVIDNSMWTSRANNADALATTTHAGNYRLLTIPNCYGLSNTPRLVLSGTGVALTTKLTVTGYRKWANG